MLMYMLASERLGRRPGDRFDDVGGIGAVGTSVPPKLAVWGASELFTNVTWSPVLSFCGVGENASTSVWAVLTPICTV